MLKNESGRSMVEMLGVLAIIGVLSVGGIAGYTMAMKKYKANEASNAIALCGVATQAFLATNPSGTPSCSDYINSYVSAYSFTDTSSGKITATVDSDACTAIGTNSAKIQCSGGTATYYFS